jgi:hypothetical protein
LKKSDGQIGIFLSFRLIFFHSIGPKNRTDAKKRIRFLTVRVNEALTDLGGEKTVGKINTWPSLLKVSSWALTPH